jgi:antitoxin ParD1/3/4
MQIILPPELEQLIQRQIAAGKYQSALDVISAGVYLLEQQDDIYQGRLPELQQAAKLGWEAAQRGELVEGAAAMAQIRENLRSRHASPES